MLNIATQFKAFRALITIMLSFPYWLGQPFKFETYDHWGPITTKREYNEKYWEHFLPRIVVSFLVLSAITATLIFIPFGFLIILGIITFASIICLMVDMLIWLCRMIFQKLDEIDREIETKELGKENLPVPVDYYKDTNLLSVLKSKLEAKQTEEIEKQKRIDEFNQQRQANFKSGYVG